MEKFKIESLIFKIFLKHVKLNKMYYIFRLSVNCYSLPQDIIHTVASKGNITYCDMMGRLSGVGSPYINARNLLDIYHIMGNGMDMKVKNTPEYQMTIMNVVNGLIHSCLEYGVIDGNYQILGKIGEDVFTEVCKKIFGDDFTDKTSEMLSLEQIKMMEKMGGMMPPPPMSGRGKGHLEKEFIEWLKTQRSVMDSMSNVRPTCDDEVRWHRTEPRYYDYFNDDDWI